MKNKCCAEVNFNAAKWIISRFDTTQFCGKKAKYYESGDWYCGKHAPSKIKEREDKSYAKWEEFINKRKKI